MYNRDRSLKYACLVSTKGAMTVALTRLFALLGVMLWATVWGIVQDEPKRPWGPEQATGPPDTATAGNFDTAWASQTPDGQQEWLLLEYFEAAVPTAREDRRDLQPWRRVQSYFVQRARGGD